MLHVIGVEIQHSARGSRSDKDARAALRVKAAKKQTHGGGITYPRTDLVTRGHGGEQRASRCAARHFTKIDDDWRGDRPGVQDRFLMDIVEFESVPGCRVDQNSARDRGLATRTENGSHRSRALLFDHRLHTLSPRQRGAEKAAAGTVEKARLHARDDFCRNGVKLYVRGKLRQRARGAGQ